uniref:Lipid-binding serum glycoprotein C-terminal domain-containing protein n=1 Tax=Plectus sambesii TaxID=2011161 RepID=A0A914V862_9BILA
MRYIFLVVVVLTKAASIVPAQRISGSIDRPAEVSPVVNPGFLTHISQKGLNFVAAYARTRVANVLRTNVHYNFTGQLATKSFNFSLNGLKINRFNENFFLSQIDILSGLGFGWRVADLTLTTESSYRISSANSKARGIANIKAYRSMVDFLFSAQVGEDGRLNIVMEDCRFIINTVTVQFSQTSADLFVRFLPLINRMAKDKLQQLFCPTFAAEILPLLTDRLLHFSPTTNLFSRYFLNSALLYSVAFRAQSIEMQHIGNSFVMLKQSGLSLNDFRLPYDAPPLIASATNNEHMVNIFMSNHTLASLLFWMDQFSEFDYDLSPETAPTKEMAEYFMTECDKESVCAGTLFPSLSRKFPRSHVEIKVTSITYPRVQIKADKIVVTMKSSVSGSVHRQRGNESFLTAKMDGIYAIRNMKMVDYALFGKLELESFIIADVVSQIEEINTESMEFLVTAFNDLVVAKDMATKLDKGIQLPKLIDFEMLNARVTFEQDRIVVAADLCAGNQCRNPVVAENSDSESVHYYDEVAT